MIPVITHHNEKAFRKALIRLRKCGGSCQRAAETAVRIIGKLRYGIEELNKFTHHGEKRIPKCIKYDISNDGHRLVTVKTDSRGYSHLLDTHEEAENWTEQPGVLRSM